MLRRNAKAERSLLFTIISRFANQSVTLQRLVSEDSYEGNTYTSAEQIAARYDPRYGLTRGIGGEERDDAGVLLTEEEVSVGDLLAGSEVRGVEPIINKKGVTLGYRAFLS